MPINTPKQAWQQYRQQFLALYHQEKILFKTNEIQIHYLYN